ncbi:zyxin-like [Carcharodon carcharias]|uniref:zyxin-like n=1 Tax=Carcharodon carcharias TaxID=13397 RepID=UPI001B7F51E1|nr:zyxin-like [Carcharodon carcharias]
MSSPDVPRASKVSSSVNVTITAPSFYNLPRKFAPVVAPKPKVNPYKSNSRPETATALPPASAGGCSRARLGRVGETPDTGPAEDFPLPPPPPADEVLLPPPPGDIPPPPPPPPPPPFEDSFPPPPAEEVFPSPPGPLEEEAPTVDWTSEAQGYLSRDATILTQVLRFTKS